MYDARPAAIRKRLDDTAKTSREVFKKAHDEALEKRVRDRLERYFDDREKALGAGLSFLDAPLPPKDHQERWSRHFAEAGSKAAKEISELVKDVKLKTPFVSVVPVIAFQESQFFAAVAKMPLAASQGRILEWYGQFMREEKNLRDDWEDLSDDGSDLAEELAEVVEEVGELYEEKIQKAAAKARDAEELFRRWFPVADKADEAMDKGEPDMVANAVKYMLEFLASLRPSTETLASRFRSLYKSQETVSVILFGKTRKEVQGFLDKVNLDRAVADFEAAAKTCVELAQDLEPDGQRDDAEDLVDKMIDAAHETLEDFEDFFEEFVDEFRHIFVGPVGDRTVKDLVDRELAMRGSEHFQRLNVQSELRKIHDAARDWFSLPIGRLPEAVREELEKMLERDLERLALAANEASDFSRSERVTFMMKMAWDEIVDEVKRLPGKVL
jgi:gas vesicle protein